MARPGKARGAAGGAGPDIDAMNAAVDRFAAGMRARLAEERRAGRDEWATWTLPQLNVRLAECYAEYLSAQSAGLPAADQQRYLLNLANYAMIHSDLLDAGRVGETRCVVAPGV
jgi:hypothetical protein